MLLHLVINVANDAVTAPEGIHQDGCVTQSGYMAIVSLLDM